MSCHNPWTYQRSETLTGYETNLPNIIAIKQLIILEFALFWDSPL